MTIKVGNSANLLSEILLSFRRLLDLDGLDATRA